MEQIRKIWLLPVFALIYQIPAIDNTDLDRNRALMFCLAGAVCVFLFYMKFLDRKKILLAIIPLAWFTVATATNWIPKYSLYELVPWYAAIGIILWSASVPRKAVFVTFLIIAAVQMGVNHFPILGDKCKFIDYYCKDYNFGTVRNSIRYGTVLLPASVYCFWYMVKSGKGGLFFAPILAVLACGIYEAEARLVTGVAVASVMAYFVSRVKSPLFRIGCVFTAAAGILALCNPSHFGVRPKWWMDGLVLLSQSVKGLLLGYGAGAWVAFVGDGHPHCEPLNIAIDFGIIGLAVVAVCGFLAVRRAIRGKRVIDAVAFLIFAATSATYSMRYWVIFFCFCLLTGQLLRDEK